MAIILCLSNLTAGAGMETSTEPAACDRNVSCLDDCGDAGAQNCVLQEGADTAAGKPAVSAKDMEMDVSEDAEMALAEDPGTVTLAEDPGVVPEQAPEAVPAAEPAAEPVTVPAAEPAADPGTVPVTDSGTVPSDESGTVPEEDISVIDDPDTSGTTECVNVDDNTAGNAGPDNMGGNDSSGLITDSEGNSHGTIEDAILAGPVELNDPAAGAGTNNPGGNGSSSGVSAGTITGTESGQTAALDTDSGSGTDDGSGQDSGAASGAGCETEGPASGSGEGCETGCSVSDSGQGRETEGAAGGSGKDRETEGAAGGSGQGRETEGTAYGSGQGRETESAAGGSGQGRETESAAGGLVENRETENLISDPKTASAEDSRADSGQETTADASGEKTAVEDGDLSVADEKYLYKDSMTIDELSLLPLEEAGAATEVALMALSEMKLMSAASDTGSLWTCSDYYINEKDLYTVRENADFSLKYQVEFHTSTQLENGCVQIRVPESFINDRSGKPVVPSQIGVPEGTPDNPCESLNSPFNWYRDGSTGELVFFNYRTILSGTNTAFQVLYHPVRIMEITDGTKWAFTPVISVTRTGSQPQTEQLDELKGSVDSHAHILSISANAFSDGTISCMPALYTRNQAERVLGSSLPSFLQEDDGTWLFVAWQIDCQGDYNQPWDLSIDAALSAEGVQGDSDLCAVGSVTSVTGTAEGDGKEGCIVKKYIPSSAGSCLAQLSSSDLNQYMKQGQFHLTTVAVTAVKRDALANLQSVISLDPSVTLTPKDGIDPAGTLDTAAAWTFVDYTWKYKGDDVGIGAWTGERYADGSISYDLRETNYPGWINEYEILEEGASGGTIPFKIRSECRGYAFTHQTQGTGAGSYRTGTGYEVTTADDVVYAIARNMDGENSSVRVLSGEDYYYSSVSLNIEDRGMDIFEDRTTNPMGEEECPGADRSTIIYAMYEGSSEWERTGECPWNDSGKITYTFTKEQLSRKPWRVKVVHNAVDYDSSCDIYADVCIRADSPVMADFLSSTENAGRSVKLEHLGSVLARNTGSGNDHWFHDTDDSASGNYSEPGLSGLTRSLYGEISMRANSYAELTELKKHAKALKTLSRENDPANGCIRLKYTIGALEGYLIYSQSAAERIAKGQTDFPSPDRREYVIYDLLPEGVIPDPSEPLKAGLVMGTQDKHLITPSLWKGKDVSVSIDPDAGVIPDWKHTGRTMLVLKVSISAEPGQIPRMCDGMWLNGIGVQFYAYCPYRDLKRMKNMSNIAAVMPGEGRDDPACQILGSADEAACDDGVIVPYSDEVKAEFKDLGADIDSDGVTDLRTVLYALASSQGDTAVSISDNIDLTVKADRDEYSSEEKSAAVGEGDFYTYRIDVTNSSARPVSELVITDHLERAAEERSQAESGRQFDTEVWQGALEEVDTEAAKRLGIKPVIYLNADRDAPLPGAGNPPETIFVKENGWVLLEDWDEAMGQACSIAVDLRKKEDGSSFILDQGDNVHISLRMKAPLIGDGEGETRAAHAYNCASFYSISQDEPDADLVTSDSVEVTLMERSALIVEKEMKGEVPEDIKDQSYLFQMTRSSRPVSLCEFRLMTRSEDPSGNVVWTDDGSLHTTGREGYFSLKQGQRAVFENEAGGDELQVCEIRSAEFESETTKEDTNEGELLKVTNSVHPTLYLKKKVYALPEGTDTSVDAFRVKVTVDGQSIAGEKYWTVDSEHGLVENQVMEEHTVDQDSCIEIHAGEVIALHPGNAGCMVSVKEEESDFGPDCDYVAVTSEKSQLLGEKSTEIVLENAWKWKDLILQKKVLHREEVPADDVFSFCLWKMHEGEDALSFDRENPASHADPVPGIECHIGDQSFTTDQDGCFSCACAGQDVVMKHLEAGREYVIEETGMPEFYEAVNGGIVSAVMPVLGEKRYAVITNNWKKRSLEVSKAVLAGKHARRTVVCTPGYPGYVEADQEGILLLDARPAGMQSFTIEFPKKVMLSGFECIQIISAGVIIEALNGTIEAGTVKTYTGSDIQVKLMHVDNGKNEGFFFYFTPAAGTDTDMGSDPAGKTFSFCLEMEDENGQMKTAAGIPYVLSSGQRQTTDENGRFTLSSGMKAVFTDLGIEGTGWRVTETPDAEFSQVYPQGQKPWTGKLGAGGADMSHALFINGEECQGMIRKQYCAAAGDDAAMQWLESERGKGTLSGLRSRFLIEIQDDSGSYVPLDGEINVADASEGRLYTSEITAGCLCLSENQTAIISGLRQGDGWRVTELETGLVEADGKIIGTECVSPGDGGTISGMVSDTMTCADFVNEIHSIDPDPETLVCKEFLSGDQAWNKVKEGAVLALRLERYENGVWKCASGVRWVQVQNGVPEDKTFNKTGSDGVIRVKKESDTSIASGNPCILPVAIGASGVRSELYYLIHEAREGDMRISEAPDLSDPSYGMLVGCRDNTFINENNSRSLSVEKQTDVNTDQSFTMQIMQRFDEGELPGRYLSYQVRDAGSDELTGTGRTDERGIFCIKSGEKAVFELAEGSSWTVTEKNCGNWKQTSCTLEGLAVDPNQVNGGVSFEMLHIVHDVTLTQEMLESEDPIKDPATGQIIDFTLPSVTIPHYVLQGGEIKEITAIGDNLFYESDVENVKIAEGIVRIGNNAFAECFSLQTVELPKSLEELGSTCFAYSGITRLEIWQNVHIVGDEIVDMCVNLEEIIIHQKRSGSAFKTYPWNFIGNVNVEFIE